MIRLALQELIWIINDYLIQENTVMAMADQRPKRPRGRPPNEGRDVPMTLHLPKDHHDYLRHLVVDKHRLGTTLNAAAEHILIRELDAMMKSGYEKIEVPK